VGLEPLLRTQASALLAARCLRDPSRSWEGLGMGSVSYPWPLTQPPRGGMTVFLRPGMLAESR
jgi:hypothetical protein